MEGCTVLRVEPDCSCTRAAYSRGRGVVTLEYTMRAFPLHLRGEESVEVSKGATVLYRPAGGGGDARERVELRTTYTR